MIFQHIETAHEKLDLIVESLQSQSNWISYLTKDALAKHIITSRVLLEQLKNLPLGTVWATQKLDDFEDELDLITSDVTLAMLEAAGHQYDLQHYQVAGWVCLNFNKAMQAIEDALIEANAQHQQLLDLRLKAKAEFAPCFVDGAIHGSVMTVMGRAVNKLCEWSPMVAKAQPLLQQVKNALVVASFVTNPLGLFGSAVAQGVTYNAMKKVGFNQRRCEQATAVAAITAPALLHLVTHPSVELATGVAGTVLGSAVGVGVTDFVLDNAPAVLSLFASKKAEMPKRRTADREIMAQPVLDKFEIRKKSRP